MPYTLNILPLSLKCCSICCNNWRLSHAIIFVRMLFFFPTLHHRNTFFKKRTVLFAFRHVYTLTSSARQRDQIGVRVWGDVYPWSRITGQRVHIARCTVPLSNGMSYVQINYAKSDMFPITYVVPQISTPGPLLYLLDKNTKKNII